MSQAEASKTKGVAFKRVTEFGGTLVNGAKNRANDFRLDPVSSLWLGAAFGSADFIITTQGLPRIAEFAPQQLPWAVADVFSVLLLNLFIGGAFYAWRSTHESRRSKDNPKTS